MTGAIFNGGTPIAPDAKYSVFRVEWGSELLGILVARNTTRKALRWGYLADSLTAKGSDDNVRAMLIQAALKDLRLNGPRRRVVTHRSHAVEVSFGDKSSLVSHNAIPFTSVCGQTRDAPISKSLRHRNDGT